jgi:hypothetical protein
MLLSAFSQSLKAQGNLVFNGSFDSGDTGWTLSGGAHIVPPIGIGTNYQISLYDSSSASALTTASQTINSLTPGLVYVVSGDYVMGKDQMPGGSPLNPSFGVMIDGAIYFQAIASGNYGWQSFNFLYTAGSSSAVLSLSAQMNGTWVTCSIDNISMQLVPEPSSEILLSFGGLFLLAISFRRQLRRIS